MATACWICPEARAQTCSPCSGDLPEIAAARQSLEEAFSSALRVSDCAGPAKLVTCRAIEAKIAEAVEVLSSLVETKFKQDAEECLSCDPSLLFGPLTEAASALTGILVDKSPRDFSSLPARLEQQLAELGKHRCCSSSEPEPADEPDPEESARQVLTETCGDQYVRNRRGLRQTLRRPGEHQGCYQSRRCREGGEVEGVSTESGFWTYDGEYWYIWGERRTPRGDWTTCNP